ncbi:MAG: FAD-dependent oxidoreductase [Bacteroidetes bacterium]|nr:FAD-dependent oxidoreductase [Bacteroidota bacterium]
MSKIGIIGGGIIGLSSAYYLNQSGHEVTVIDQSDLSDGCSHGNAGMIVPSHFIPLAAPGMVAKGIRWMFHSSSPFFVRPRLNGDLIRWGLLFLKSANEKHVAAAIPALKELSLLSKFHYQQWAHDLPFNFGYHERGLLMLYQTKEAEHEESETAHRANDIGITAKILSGEEVQQLEPYVKVNVRGGIYFPGDAHLTPKKLFNRLKSYLQKKGVTFVTNSAVSAFQFHGQNIQSVQAGDQIFSFDQIVLAAGSWSGLIAKQLALTLPMQGGKGYSFTLPEVEKNVQIPSIFLEARVAVTPMENSLRFGGTMEIAGLNHSVNLKRVKGIVDSIPKYYPEMKVAMPMAESIWHGLRPCSPDGLPYIGRSTKIKNLVIATGHSMMGLSLAPATGKLVSEIIDEKKTSMVLTAFSPDRFQR